jgi:hypothetical protein
MSLVDELRTLKQSNPVTLMSFLQNLRKNKPTVHIFYEGKTDNGFYGSLLRKELKEDARIKTLVCGNKDEVYKVRQKLLIRDYPNDSLLFMVDKDLDNIIPRAFPPHDDIHVTETYSIENYLVSTPIFEQAVSEILKLNIGDKQLEHLKNKFAPALSIFCETMIPIMAWIVCSRRLGIRPNLSNIKMNEIFNIDDNLILTNKLTESELYSYIESVTKVNTTIFNSFINTVKNELSGFSYESFIRGKYHLWFFIEFFDRSKKVLEVANGAKIKVHFNLNTATALDFLGPRIRTPKSLQDFCTSICNPIFLAA